MKKTFENGNIILNETECFDVGLCLDCGQAFRWKQNENGEWQGVAHGKSLKIKQEGSTVIFFNTTEEDFCNVWSKYFDLERDYPSICERLKADEHLEKAITECAGIRILKQEEWEALCSFIISQNNNIKRIKE